MQLDYIATTASEMSGSSSSAPLPAVLVPDYSGFQRAL